MPKLQIKLVEVSWQVDKKTRDTQIVPMGNLFPKNWNHYSGDAVKGGCKSFLWSSSQQ